MSKYKTANTNKYVDKNKSQTIEKQLKPDSIGDNYFQKVISPSTPFNSMSKNAIIQKKELPPVVQEIIDYVKSLSENPENKKLIENLFGSANNTISNLGTDALRLVNRGAYRGVDALENMRLLNSGNANKSRLGILTATAQETLPTDELRGKAYNDLKRLYDKSFPDERNYFQKPTSVHPLDYHSNQYTKNRNRVGLGLGLGGGAALAAQGFNDEQENGYEMPGSNKSMLKGNTKKRDSFQKGDYASGLFNDGNGSGIHYDGQPMPSKKGSSKIHYDGQPMPSDDESEIQYDGQRKPSEIHYDGQPMPIKNQYDRQEMPSSILSQLMPQIGPNILSQVMPKNGSNILSQVMPKNESNILSQVMPENWSNIANQYMPEKMIELLSELGLLSNGSNNGGINPTGIRYSGFDRRKKIQASANGEEGDGQQISFPRPRPRNLRQTIPARDIHNGFTGDEYRQLLDHIIPGAGAQYENATAKELSELLGNMNDYPSITNAVKGFTLKRAVKKRGSVRKGDYETGLFRRRGLDNRTWDVPFVSPQRPSDFGFESMPGSEIYRYPMGYGLKGEGEVAAVYPGTSPAENAVRQSMPRDVNSNNKIQSNYNDKLMDALKEYASNTFNNTKPYLDATLFNGDEWNRNFTKPLTNIFNSNIVDPMDAWLHNYSMKEGKPRNNISDPDNPNLGKRMSKRMHKRMDEDMAVTPRKVSTNRSISSKNKYFK